MAVDLNAPAYFTAGYQSNWGFDEYYFSPAGKDLKLGLKADNVDGDGFGTGYKNYRAGIVDAKADVKGMWNGNPAGLSAVVNQRYGRKSPVNYWEAHDGLQVGRAITGMPATIMDRSINASMKDSTEVDMSFGAQGFVDDGFILVSPKTATPLATTGTGGIDMTSTVATPNGGAAYLWVWAVDAGTTPTCVVKVQHSPDGTTWTDLVTFTTVVGTPGTGTWSQRFPISSTVTIQQQVRANWTTTGTPTGIQGMVMYSRTPDRSL